MTISAMQSNHSKWSFLWCMILLITMSACQKRPKDVVSESKMAHVLADMTLAEAYSNRPDRAMLTDSSKRILRESILMHHGLTEQQFDSTLMWYGRHMDKYAELSKKIDKVLEEKENHFNEQEDNESNSSDNLWPNYTMLTITPRSYTDHFSFSLPGTVASPGEALEWRLVFHRLLGNATMVMMADYPKGKRVISRSTLRESGPLSTTLHLDAAMGAPKRIIGYVQLSDRPPMTVWADSITLHKFTPMAGQIQSSAPATLNTIAQ